METERVTFDFSEKTEPVEIIIYIEEALIVNIYI